MDKQMYQRLQAHMLHFMADSAHDCQHVYRVLYAALEIAATQEGVDSDVLIAACLLHDIGRDKQNADPTLCHALEGSKMAHTILCEEGWENEKAQHVVNCIATHRYRSDNPPKSLEAKILFDADKLDVTGAIGVARTLLYEGRHGEALYNVDAQGDVLDGQVQQAPSFFREYHFKLKGVYDGFYTAYAAQIASQRQGIMTAYYQNLLAEVRDTQMRGKKHLQEALD